ncbi:MAG: glycosyltransferase [Porticoccaceae bacterium]
MLSIIIINYRTWKFTQRAIRFLLSSLPAEVRPNHDLEIIVVDNHSDDEQSQGFIKDNPDVRVYSSEGNFGYSHGCNQGALHARGNWLLFMNPDVLADWKSLSRLLNAATTDSVHAIYTARQLNEAGRLQRSLRTFHKPNNVFSPGPCSHKIYQYKQTPILSRYLPRVRKSLNRRLGKRVPTFNKS